MIWFEKTAVNQHSWTIITRAGCTAKSRDASQKVGYWTENQNQQTEKNHPRKEMLNKTLKIYFLIPFAMKSLSF